MGDPIERNLEPDLADDIRDVPAKQCDLHVLTVASQIELLPQSHGAQRIHARVAWLAAPQQRQARAAAPDLCEKGARAPECSLAFQPIADGEKDEPAFFRLIDHFEDNTGTRLSAIEEHLSVARLAYRAGRG